MMMSAMADETLTHRRVELGAYDFIQKPIDPDDLEQRIIACLASGEFHQLPWWKRLGNTL